MNLTINQQAHQLPDDATVVDAIAAIGARPPFAVAVNTVFIPKTHYAQQQLHTGDRVEIISPITGG
ncbi:MULTISPECIES: sulfur carrier protein ThiS [Giesbergeria]|uniref:Sulfur carrier protein ThiS n=1 Tax=Giesbergeria sinuosa TaxID=80883 RepID=A0ABV9QCW3_9BURK